MPATSTATLKTACDMKMTTAVIATPKLASDRPARNERTRGGGRCSGGRDRSATKMMTTSVMTSIASMVVRYWKPGTVTTE